MQKDEYNYRQRNEVLQEKKPHFKFAQDHKIELHHIFGKANSSTVIPLCTNCHNCVTSYQNNLSREERKDKLLMALMSLKGLRDLEGEMLGAIINQLREYHEPIPKELSKQD